MIIDRDFNVIAGHGRIFAAKEEGIKEVPCVLVDYLTEAQKKAYIIADNRMAMDAGWDEELLRVEIEALQAEAFDLSLTGFDEEESAEISNLRSAYYQSFVEGERVWKDLATSGSSYAPPREFTNVPDDELLAKLPWGYQPNGKNM